MSIKVNIQEQWVAVSHVKHMVNAVLNEEEKFCERW